MSNKTVVKIAGLIVGISLLGRIAGFVREQVIASAFGVTGAADAYFLAFTIPNFVFVLLGGALSTAFIPVFTQYLLPEQRESAWRMSSTVITIILVFTVLTSLLGILITPYLINIIAEGFSPENKKLATTMTQIMFPSMIFMTLSVVATGILNSLKHFIVPAFTAVAFSGTVIVSIYLFKPEFGIIGLAIGSLLAAAVQLLIQLPVLRNKGFKYYFSLDLNHPGLRQIFVLILPVIAGTAISQTYILIDRYLASQLAEGSIAALNYASKLMNLPLNLFVFALGTAIFPTLAEQAASKDNKALANTTAMGVNLVSLLTIPASVGLLVLAEPIVRLLFERGAFDARATAMTSVALQFFVLGLSAQAVINVLNRAFFALQDTKTPARIGIAAVLVNLVFSIILREYLQHAGLALANALAAIFNFSLVFWALTRRLNDLPSKNISITLGKITLASVGMGVASLATANFLALKVNLLSTMGKLIQVGGSIGIGIIVYGVIIVLLKIEETDYLVKKIKEISQKVKKK